MERSLAVPFDIADYKRRTGPIVFDDLDLAHFAEHPLAPRRAALHRRDARRRVPHGLLPARPAGHARARGSGDHRVPDLLEPRGALARRGARGGARRRTARSAGARASGRCAAGSACATASARSCRSSGSTVAGEEFIALHMTWGAINEACAQASYGQLARRADDPVLTALLQRIMRQEGRHLDFYASEATKRLEPSAKARRLTRCALRVVLAPGGLRRDPARRDALPLGLPVRRRRGPRRDATDRPPGPAVPRPRRAPPGRGRGRHGSPPDDRHSHVDGSLRCGRARRRRAPRSGRRSGSR